MDAGIGESMLIGAALGGGTSALTGKNPLLGAGLGALGGAFAPGIGDMLSGASEAAAIPIENSTSLIQGTTLPPVNDVSNSFISGGTSEAPITISDGTTEQLINAGNNNVSNIVGKGIGNLGPNTGTSNGYLGLNTQNMGGVNGLNIPQYQIPNDSVMSSVNQAVANNAGKTPGMFDSAMNWVNDHPWASAGIAGGAALLGSSLLSQNQYKPPGLPDYTGPLSHYKFDPYAYQPAVAPNYGSPYVAHAAEGGLMNDYGSGGITALGGNNMYPGSQQNPSEYAKSSQMPNAAMKADYDPETNPYTGDISQNMASGGITSLGSYSDGGHLLKGPGDGMSDDIPARIGHKQEARLADGEFVIPADVVSHLGNGSTDAGAKQLYNMMDKVRKARTGNPKQGKRIDPDRLMPKFADGGIVPGYNGNYGGSYPQYSYADLMNELRSNPQAFQTTPVASNNQQMGIQSLTNNNAIAQAQQAQQNAQAAPQPVANYGSYQGN